MENIWNDYENSLVDYGNIWSLRNGTNKNTGHWWGKGKNLPPLIQNKFQKFF